MADEPTTLRTIGNDIGEGIRDATNAVLDFNISKEAIVELLMMFLFLYKMTQTSSHGTFLRTETMIRIDYLPSLILRRRII